MGNVSDSPADWHQPTGLDHRLWRHAVISGGAGADSLSGAAGNDSLRCGDDLLDGRGGDQRLIGGAGSDTLIVGTGDNHRYGGSVGDRCAIAHGWGHDTVIGGEAPGDLDRINATAITGDLTVIFSGTEAGSPTGTGGSTGFSQIEALTLVLGNDRVEIGAGMRPIRLGGGAGAGRLKISDQAAERDDISFDHSSSGRFLPHAGGRPRRLRSRRGAAARRGPGPVVPRRPDPAHWCPLSALTFQKFEDIAFDNLCLLPGSRSKTGRGEVAIKQLAPVYRFWAPDRSFPPLRRIGSARRPAGGEAPVAHSGGAAWQPARSAGFATASPIAARLAGRSDVSRVRASGPGTPPDQRCGKPAGQRRHGGMLLDRH